MCVLIVMKKNGREEENMNKEFDKIRNLLGNKYHLCIKIGENFEVNEWHLFRRYDDTKVYFSEDNVEIMSSEANTLEELKEFAKKHHQIDEHTFMSYLYMLITWVAFAILMVNTVTWKSNIVRIVIITMDLTCLLLDIIAHCIWRKNWNVRMYELKENLKNLSKERKMRNEKR